MNEDKKVYVVFNGNSLIGTPKGVFCLSQKTFGYLHVNNYYSVEEWNLTNIFLTLEQVIEVLERYNGLTGKNVYEFINEPDHQLDCVINMFKIDTYEAASFFDNVGDYTNSELIKKLRMEEKGDDLKIIEDAVKRPSHYILEDGTEVKNHIRSILGDDGFKSWAIGNAIKYVSRYKDKGKPVQDLKKAQENIQMVIDVLGEQDDLDK